MVWALLFQKTAYFCGILHLAQTMGQAGCCGDMRNSVIAVCLPLPPPPANPVHPKRVAEEEAAAQSPLKNGSLSFPEQCPQWHQEHCHQMLEGMKAGLASSRRWLCLHGKWGHQAVPSREGQEHQWNSMSCHSAGLPSNPLEENGAITCSSSASYSPVIVHQQCQAPIVPSCFPKT